MAMLPMIKENKFKVIHTAASNQTYSAQLTEIYSYYQKLNLSQKENSILNIAGNQQHIFGAGGRYTSIAITTSNTLILTDVDLSIPSIKRITINPSNSNMAFNDLTSTTNTGQITLSIYE